MSSSDSLLLEARDVCMSFGLTRVLKNVDLPVRRGEIHGLVGHNGSGKSTLIKILSGFHSPDSGSLYVRDEEIPLPVTPKALARMGIGFMHQDLGLEASLSILDNYLLDGRSGIRRIRWKQERHSLQKLLSDFGLRRNVSDLIAALTGTEKTVVALVRALRNLDSDEATVLVLDEPTAALERGSAEILFAAIRALRDRGCGIVLVTHDLQELRTLCDRVTVLRNGSMVANGQMSALTDDELLEAIIGAPLGQLYPPHVRKRQDQPIALSVNNLKGASVATMSFDLHEGEILGLTGLPGMGQDDVPSLLFGDRRAAAGVVSLYGAVHAPTPQNSLAHGVAYLPADRKGLAGDQASSVSENLTLPVLKRYFRHGKIDHASLSDIVTAALREFDVQPRDPGRPLGTLSGGNQQKALLAKWMCVFQDTRVLLLHEPTRGIDIGARQAIFHQMRARAENGMSILYVSNEHEDLAHLCDRVLVMREGRIVEEFVAPEIEAPMLAASTLRVRRYRSTSQI